MKRFISNLYIKQRATLAINKFKRGWEAVFISILIWLIYQLSPDQNMIDFWISLDDGEWVGYQHIHVYSQGYYLREERRINTFPKPAAPSEESIKNYSVLGSK
jgi:hypothetical protein